MKPYFKKKIMVHEDSDLILFQLLQKAAISADDALLIKKYLSSVITESIEIAVTKALSRVHFPEYPNCPLPSNLTPAKVTQLISTFEAVGDGDMAHGIERIRDNHRFITKMRKVQNKIGMVIASSLILATLTLMVTGVGMAVMAYIKTGVK